MQQAIVQLQNVTKQFSQNVAPAVDNVSLTLQKGDILGLLGPSGCGKTTLLRMIAGFENLQSGKIEIGGRIVCDASGGLRQRSLCVPAEQRDIGIVFQDYALFPHLNVAENVAFGLKHSTKQQIQKRIAEVIELVNLPGLEKRYPYELSGGQQQRVALARALAPQPQLMLLDEPLSNLDIQVRLRLREEIRDILKAAGTSAIFVTHDQEEALAISDIVGVMRQGHLEQLGTPEEIYTHPASRFVAEFVTQANFLPARRQGNIWETEVGNFELPVDDTNDTGEIMIRQEGLRLEAASDSPVFIHSRRFLGREYLYCLKTASGKEIHARTRDDIPLPIGARVQVSVPSNTVKVFTQ
ncbi:ABC transporter ATP-binding protein [Nodularia sphaerocarpa]|uniref:ABC transporter ATP-binding protein n=1 Tax=Nodularia sphaerocarpa TaxID=137816 RepID=UPI001EFA968A|nr:ABC transporter ATP-binding protein [Nodularia sphaerocarpa]MDB9373022.1 ABC transporter ATP-binding protein [Nodularia sphaerocarpa CS-585]MDB9377500.1 ABC transporter ATP-binding protein [Nodularia sphaerocarpa CS-585A2]ULP73947.1 Sulfate/thiosulfate import ATP-binding protein CysA [Nodularia sphaerocarpa UHCC 0038]